MLYIGSPMWGYKEWVGNFFPPHTQPGDFLRLYSQKLTTVEGNTTFYALPSAETIAHWSQETPSYFRFCPKISRDISHSAALDARKKETEVFTQRMRGLAACRRERTKRHASHSGSVCVAHGADKSARTERGRRQNRVGDRDRMGWKEAPVPALRRG